MKRYILILLVSHPVLTESRQGNRSGLTIDHLFFEREGNIGDEFESDGKMDLDEEMMRSEERF